MGARRRLTAWRSWLPRSGRPWPIRELAAWLGGRRRWYRVAGDSMTPTLEGGDLVLVDPKRAMAAPLGSIVVLRDPERADRFLVKRLGSRGDDTFAVTSDNPADARDSRRFGSLPSHHLIGPATLIFTRGGALRPCP